MKKLIIPTVCLAVLSTPAFEEVIHAAQHDTRTEETSLKALSTTKYVSVNPGSSLNLRESASTDASISTRLPNGTPVTVYSESNGWAKVSVDGKNGFVSSSYLSNYKLNPVNTSTATPEATTKYVRINPGSSLNVREKATISASILTKLSNGTPVSVYAEGNGWAKVSVNGKNGFVSSFYLANSKPGSEAASIKETTTKYVKVNPGSRLNVRESASTKSYIITKLANNSLVTVYSESNGWAKISVNGKNGFVSTKFLADSKSSSTNKTSPAQEQASTTTKYVKVNLGSSLNVRASASINSSIIAKLSNETPVTVYSEANGWAKISVNEKSGFVSTKYLANSKSSSHKSPTPVQEPASSTTKYVNVNPGSSLNVRASASTNSSVITKLSNKTPVTVYSEANGWAKISVNGKNGFVSTKYLANSKPSSHKSPTPVQEPASSTTKYVNVNPGSSLNVRASASTKASIIAKLSNETPVTVYSEANGWAKIKVNDKVGYVSTAYIASVKPSAPITTEIMFVDVEPGSSLNMRNRPSLNGSVIIKLARGVEVTVYSEANGWAKIKAYGQEGYVSTDFLSSIKPRTTQEPDPIDDENKSNDPNNTQDDNTETQPEGDSGTGHEASPTPEEGSNGNNPSEDGDNGENELENPPENDGTGPNDNSESESDNESPEDEPILKYVNVSPGSNLNLRSGPSTNTSIITKLAAGTVVTVHSEGKGWSKVTANGLTGYVSSQYLLTKPTSETPNGKINTVMQDYDISLDALTQIQLKANPQTDKKYNTYIRGDALLLNNQTNPTSGIVQGTGWNLRGGVGTDHWVVGKVNNGESLQILSKVKGADGYDWYEVKYNKTWVNASPDDVKYYLNPNNFINNPVTSFQFLKLSNTTYLDQFEVNERILAGKGVLEGHAATFITASEKYGVNEMYLISHALLETGNGSSQLAKGVEIYGKKVYNMFGIGAYDGNAVTSGTQYAYNAGWFTPEAAIIGGAKFIAQSYINSGQDTLYKMRWNPNATIAYGVASHQYATDIGWATKQVNQIYNLYSLLSSYQITLEIPKYN